MIKYMPSSLPFFTAIYPCLLPKCLGVSHISDTSANNNTSHGAKHQNWEPQHLSTSARSCAIATLLSWPPPSASPPPPSIHSLGTATIHPRRISNSSAKNRALEPPKWIQMTQEWNASLLLFQTVWNITNQIQISSFWDISMSDNFDLKAASPSGIFLRQDQQEISMGRPWCQDQQLLDIHGVK